MDDKVGDVAAAAPAAAGVDPNAARGVTADTLTTSASACRGGAARVRQRPEAYVRRANKPPRPAAVLPAKESLLRVPAAAPRLPTTDPMVRRRAVRQLPAIWRQTPGPGARRPPLAPNGLGPAHLPCASTSREARGAGHLVGEVLGAGHHLGHAGDEVALEALQAPDLLQAQLPAPAQPVTPPRRKRLSGAGRNTPARDPARPGAGKLQRQGAPWGIAGKA